MIPKPLIVGMLVLSAASVATPAAAQIDWDGAGGSSGPHFHFEPSGSSGSSSSHSSSSSSRRIDYNSIAWKRWVALSRQESQGLINDGDQAMRAGDYSEAAADFSKALGIDQAGKAGEIGQRLSKALDGIGQQDQERLRALLKQAADEPVSPESLNRVPPDPCGGPWDDPDVVDLRCASSLVLNPCVLKETCQPQPSPQPGAQDLHLVADTMVKTLRAWPGPRNPEAPLTNPLTAEYSREDAQNLALQAAIAEQAGSDPELPRLREAVLKQFSVDIADRYQRDPQFRSLLDSELDASASHAVQAVNGMVQDSEISPDRACQMITAALYRIYAQTTARYRLESALWRKSHP